MDLGLDGTKVMILGASRGIGRMTAEIFAKEGADPVSYTHLTLPTMLLV